MKYTMNISIIVPVYNVEKYISRCIDSIISQTFKNWELILIDDGSPDNSGKICDEYANIDSRIKVFHIQNSGVAKARFIGVSHASNEYICFIDSDDSIPNNSLELLCKHNVNNSYDIIAGSYTRIFSNDRKDFCGLTPCSLSGEEYLMMLLTGNWKLYGPVAKLYRRTLFTSNNLPNIPKKIRVGEDLLMNIFIACYANRICLIPDSVYNYFQIGTSVTHNFKYTIEYTKDFIDILSNILLTSNQTNVNTYLTHYKLNMIYNVILDDINDKINYQSEFITTLLKDAHKTRLNSKEKIIIILLKNKYIRIYYRIFFRRYRNGDGFIYSFIKLLKCLFI